MFQLEYRRNGRREAKSLKHRDWEVAKTQADRLAANFPPPEAEPEPQALTLGRLFEMYLGEVTPKNSERHQKYDRSAASMRFRQVLCSPRWVDHRERPRPLEAGQGTHGPEGPELPFVGAELGHNGW